jgi:hypothetical protein
MRDLSAGNKADLVTCFSALFFLRLRKVRRETGQLSTRLVWFIIPVSCKRSPAGAWRGNALSRPRMETGC